MSNLNASELVAIFTDYDETHAPKDGRAVRLTISSDVAFLEVGTFTETVKDKVAVSTFTATQTVGVDAELLLHTLTAMVRRSDREAHDRARNGELHATHPAWTTERAATVLPATRNRA